jgi:octaprenyl-diphosphate synthase
MLQLAHHDRAIQAEIDRRLVAVEQRFTAELVSDLDCVNQLTQHVERYRGKMLRPTLVFASAMAGFPERDDTTFNEGIETLATVCEMVHMATLVHDDILDEAELRRRGRTINQLQGNEAAVMLGDYLISHAYHLCSSLGVPAASKSVAAATNTVCEGELLQLHHRNDWSLTETTYYEIVRRKTASLCATCCHLPAVLDQRSEVREGVGDVLYQYGELLGTAFQVIDDVLDLDGDARQVGKTLGRDLEKGKLTLPLIRWLSNLSPASRAEAEAKLNQVTGPDAVDWLRNRLADSDALDWSRQQARNLIDQAQNRVSEQLPEGPAVGMLLEMAGAVITRQA